MKNENILSYRGYYTRIAFDSEISKLTGKIEGINDLIYFESSDADSIIIEFQSAVDDYLEFCNANDIEPDKVFKGTFNVRIQPKLHKKLSQYAFSNNESLNATVEKSIEYFLEHKPFDIMRDFRDSLVTTFSLATEDIIRKQDWGVYTNEVVTFNSSENAYEN